MMTRRSSGFLRSDVSSAMTTRTRKSSKVYRPTITRKSSEMHRPMMTRRLRKYSKMYMAEPYDETCHDISVQSPNRVQIYLRHLRRVLFLSSPESSNRIYPSQVLSLIHDDDEDAHKDTYDDPVVDDGEDAHEDAQVNPSQDLMPTFGFLRF